MLYRAMYKGVDWLDAGSSCSLARKKGLGTSAASDSSARDRVWAEFLGRLAVVLW